MPTPTHRYLFPAEQAGELPAKDWKKSHISILASLPQDISESFHVTEWTEIQLRAVLGSIRAAVPKADLGVSFMASSQVAVQRNERSLATFLNYDLEGPWLENVKVLAAAARDLGFAFAGMDCEIYPWTVNPRTGKLHDGGPMVPGVAWPASPQVQAHAKQFRAALGGLPLLCFVWLDDLLRTTRAGVPLFPGWRAWVRGAGSALILDEGAWTARKGYTSTHWEHVPVVQGEYLTRKVARGLARRKESRFLWSPEPPGSIWG
jgi:hypothetical protein